MKWLSFRLNYFPGKDALEKKEWIKAEASLEKAVQIFPAHSEAVLSLAQAKWNLNKKEEAFHLIEPLLEHSSDSTAAYFLMGRFSLEEKQTDKACEYFKKAVESNPKNIEAWYELARIYLKLNETAKSIEALDQVTQQEPFFVHTRMKDLMILQKS